LDIQDKAKEVVCLTNYHHVKFENQSLNGIVLPLFRYSLGCLIDVQHRGSKSVIMGWLPNFMKINNGKKCL
jgi:hypothetical protein